MPPPRLKPFPLPYSIGIDICHIPRIRELLRSSNWNSTKPANPASNLLEPESPPPPEPGTISQPEPSSNNEISPKAGKFIQKLFNEREREQIGSRRFGNDATVRWLAGRWAVKEAVIKAHRKSRLRYHDITILKGELKNGIQQAPVASVKIPQPKLSDGDVDGTKTEKKLGTLGLVTRRVTDKAEEEKPDEEQEVLISISHDGEYATAVCLAYEGHVPTRQDGGAQVPDPPAASLPNYVPDMVTMVERNQMAQSATSRPSPSSSRAHQWSSQSRISGIEDLLRSILPKEKWTPQLRAPLDRINGENWSIRDRILGIEDLLRTVLPEENWPAQLRAKEDEGKDPSASGEKPKTSRRQELKRGQPRRTQLSREMSCQPGYLDEGQFQHEELPSYEPATTMASISCQPEKSSHKDQSRQAKLPPDEPATPSVSFRRVLVRGPSISGNHALSKDQHAALVSSSQESRPERRRRSQVSIHQVRVDGPKIRKFYAKNEEGDFVASNRKWRRRRRRRSQIPVKKIKSNPNNSTTGSGRPRARTPHPRFRINLPRKSYFQDLESIKDRFARREFRRGRQQRVVLVKRDGVGPARSVMAWTRNPDVVRLAKVAARLKARKMRKVVTLNVEGEAKPRVAEPEWMKLLKAMRGEGDGWMRNLKGSEKIEDGDKDKRQR